MTNDTSTLMGSLAEMKDQLISELANKGVTATFSSTTGLLGLIDKIGDIDQTDVSGAIATIVGHPTFLTTYMLETDLMMLPTWAVNIKDINGTGLNSKPIKLYIDGTYKTSANSSNGRVWFMLDSYIYTEGTYTLKAVFEGDSTYAEAELSVTATFEEGDTPLIIE